MTRPMCLYVFLLSLSLVYAADPVPEVFMQGSRDNFGAQGDDYSPGEAVWHCGWDILAPLGTPIKAIGDGVVVGCSPGGWDDQNRRENYGLVIRHKTASGEEFVAIYGHLKRQWNTPAHRLLNDDEVRGCMLGAKVVEGGVIGKIGAYSSPHLHLAIYYDPGQPGDFPSSGYGRQPLPRPAQTDYQSVVSFGNWRNPKQWLYEKTTVTNYYNDTMPVGATDGSKVFFIRTNQRGEQALSSVSVDGGDVNSELPIDSTERVDQMFAGPGSSIFLRSRSIHGSFHLYQYNGTLRRICARAEDYQIGGWRNGRSYIPVRRNMPWEVMDLTSGEIKPRKPVMSGAVLSGVFQITPNQIWRILGNSIDLPTGFSRPVSWIITTDTQVVRAVSGVPDGDCQGLLVLGEKDQVSTTESERLMLGLLESGHYRLKLANLTPKADVMHDGYKLAQVTTPSIFDANLDVIPYSRMNCVDGEVVLHQVRMLDHWCIFRTDEYAATFKRLTR